MTLNYYTFNFLGYLTNHNQLAMYFRKHLPTLYNIIYLRVA